MNQKHNPYFFSFFLALLVGFSTYTVFGFFSSVDHYVENHGAANVLGIGENSEVLEGDGGVEGAVLDDVQVFSDVALDHPNREALEFLYYEGVLNSESGEARPEDKISRAEFSKMIMESGEFDYSSYGVLENCFEDVRTVKEHWFAPFVCSAAAEGFVSGFEGNVFRPADNVNRAAAAKVVLKAFGYVIPESVESSTFKDVEPGDWFAPIAEAAKNNGVVDGDLIFAAGTEITRGEMAQMIYNAGYSTL